MSPTGRGQRCIGRSLNDGHTSPCLDENLKCSVNCCIVRLFATNSTAMTKQDKITVFDALIKPFLCSDALTSDLEGDNLYEEAHELTDPSISLLLRCICKVSLPAKSIR